MRMRAHSMRTEMYAHVHIDIHRRTVGGDSVCVCVDMVCVCVWMGTSERWPWQ